MRLNHLESFGSMKFLASDEFLIFFGADGVPLAEWRYQRGVRCNFNRLHMDMLPRVDEVVTQWRRLIEV